ARAPVMLRACSCARRIFFSAELDDAGVDPPLAPEPLQLVVVRILAATARLRLEAVKRDAFGAGGSDGVGRLPPAPPLRTPANSWRLWSRPRRRTPTGMPRTVF